MTLKILIVDDRNDVRSDLRELIELNLPDGTEIEVIDIFPLDEIRAYASFILEHDVCALLLDEQLGERKNPETGAHISYYGHDVIECLRDALPDFPVYIVTTFGIASDLVAKEAEFEDLIERDLILQKPEMYTNRIKRAASRFQEAMHRHLERLNTLTLKAAHGNLSPEEQSTLASIRQLLGLPFTGDSDLVVSDLIAEGRLLANKSEQLLDRILQGQQ
ncbi:hypothetical protein [Bordetella genomosp. 13]|uniref:hypothetical protein n=1 Tax=Bordetella genomosp. 13 TaxID=463040 RepID=UPI0012FB1C65|nr:hypothetical protein [Bordetella genomosp. 13]